MLTELVGEHGGVEPVERQLPPVDHFDQAFEHLALVADLVAEAKLLVTLDQAEGPHHCRLGRALFLLLHGSTVSWPRPAPGSTCLSLNDRHSNPCRTRRHRI